VRRGTAGFHWSDPARAGAGLHHAQTQDNRRHLLCVGRMHDELQIRKHRRNVVLVVTRCLLHHCDSVESLCPTCVTVSPFCHCNPVESL